MVGGLQTRAFSRAEYRTSPRRAWRFWLCFFLVRLAAPRTVQPALLPFTPQFSPFPAYYLTNPYWHAILSRVYRSSSLPSRRPCGKWLFCLQSSYSNDSDRSDGHFVCLFFSIACETLLPVMLQRNAIYPLYFLVFADYFLRNRGVHPPPPKKSPACPERSRGVPSFQRFTHISRPRDSTWSEPLFSLHRSQPARRGGSHGTRFTAPQ